MILLWFEPVTFNNNFACEGGLNYGVNFFFLMVGKVVCSYKCMKRWNVCLDKEPVSLKLPHINRQVQDINLLRSKAETTYLNYNFMVFAGALAEIQQTTSTQVWWIERSKRSMYSSSKACLVLPFHRGHWEPWTFWSTALAVQKKQPVFKIKPQMASR